MPFDHDTRRILAIEAGGRCAAPHCGRDIGWPGEPNCLGDAAHIHGSKPTAPRYDETIPVPFRECEDNGLWLCPACHRMIDRFVDQYPPSELFRWKSRTAEMVSARRGQLPAPVGSSDLADDLNRAQAFLDDQWAAVTALRQFRAIRPPFSSLPGVALPADTRTQVTRLVGIRWNRPFESDRYPNWCYTFALASRQQELLRLLRGIAELREFSIAARDIFIHFKTDACLDSEDRTIERYIHPAAAAIVAYLEYYEEFSNYVAIERMPRARLRPGAVTW